jgi:hypothetical protein
VLWTKAGSPGPLSAHSLGLKQGPCAVHGLGLKQGPCAVHGLGLKQGPCAVLAMAVWEWECTRNHRHLGGEFEIALRQNGPANGRLAVDDVHEECSPPSAAGDILVRDVLARAGACFGELGFRP